MTSRIALFRLRQCFALLLGVLALGACGGGGSGAATAVTPPVAVIPPTALTPPDVLGPGLRAYAGQVGEKLPPPMSGGAGNGLVSDGRGGLYSSAYQQLIAISATGQTSTIATGPGACLFQGVVRAANGTLFATCGNAVYRLPVNGVLTLLAGAEATVDPSYGYVDGPGLSARFGGAGNIVLDAQGNLILTDYANGVLRKIAPDGMVSTLAGNANAPREVIDGLGAAARFSLPEGLAIVADGTLFVTDNHTVRSVSPLGAVRTLAGQAGVPGWADGAGSAVRLNLPKGLATDRASNVYIADTDNNVIRKMTPGGQVTTLAGSPWQKGSTDGLGDKAGFYYPFNLTIGDDANIYVADTFNGTIRKVTPAGEVSTFAGTAVLPRSSGSIDGALADARFYDPRGVAIDAKGTMFVADYANRTIRKISPSGQVSTLAGSAHAEGDKDGVGVIATFHGPDALAVDGAGILYTIDNFVMSYATTRAIRRISQLGEVATYTMPVDPLNLPQGAVAISRGAAPLAIAADAAGNFYFIASVFASAECIPKFPCIAASQTVLRKVNMAGVASTLASTPTDLYPSGQLPSLQSPGGMAVDKAGNVYIADTPKHTILRVTPEGTVSILAGSAGAAGSADGQGGAARFSSPSKLQVDASGNVFVLDSGNVTIRRIQPDGTVTTVVGTAGRNALQLGALPGSLSTIGGFALDAKGSVLVALANGLIRVDF